MSNRWPQIKHFTKNENWGDPNKIKLGLLYELDKYREFTGKKFVVHRAYSAARAGSTHAEGIAVDGHTEGLSLLEQYLAAERFGFNGIGVYDSNIWNNPGLHLDLRINQGRWGCRWKHNAAGKGLYDPDGEKIKDYVALDTKFIGGLL